MNILAVTRIALRALWAHRLRTSLTMLGLIIGVGAIVMVLAVAAGARARIEQQIGSLGSNHIVIFPGSVTSKGAWLGYGSQHSLTEDDAYAIDREVPAVRAADPGIGGATHVVGGDSNWSTELWAASHKHFEVREWIVARGEPFSDSDVQRASKVAVIGETVARQLFGEADPIGQVIRVNRVPLTVIGLLQRKGQSHVGRDQDDVILVPISTARSRILGAAQTKRRSVQSISVKVWEEGRMAEAEHDIRALLRQRHRLQPWQDDDFYVRNMTEILSAREASSRIMTLLLAAIASVSLLVSGIGIMNIMLVSVAERGREIGLRMAVGARARDILIQFLAESITLALIGGFLGIAVGVAGSSLIGHITSWPIALRLDSIALAVGFASVIGVSFGLYPACKASRMTPIDALRCE